MTNTYTTYYAGHWHLESEGEVILRHEDWIEFQVLCEEYFT